QGEGSQSGSESAHEDCHIRKSLSNASFTPLHGYLDGKSMLQPPLIIHTAATPMPMPKCALFGDIPMACESRRESNVSGGPHACEIRPMSSSRNSPHSSWGAVCSWNSRRSSWNSIGRASSLKRHEQSGEHKSLLSADGKESSEGDTSDEEVSSRTGSSLNRMDLVDKRDLYDLHDTLHVPYPYGMQSRHSLPGEYQDCNGKTSPSTVFPQLHLEDSKVDYSNNIDDDLNMSRGERLKAWIISHLPAWCKERETWSLYLFPPYSKFRLICNKIITHRMFDHVVLVIIFLNCITIAMERPKIDSHSAERIFLTLSNYIFTLIFVAEMTVKVVAMNFCFGGKAYLRSSWNVLDGMLVLISVIDILVSMVSDSGTKILGMLRVLRLLRT
ncbi:hypothetical protein XELAEV_180466606mg, partial [Xenopus laevis]